MKHLNTHLFPLLISLLCLPLFLPGCYKKPLPPPRGPVQVSVFEVEPHDVPAVFTAVGTAKSSHMVDIRARVEGYLDSINYSEGSIVPQGKLLFQIDPRPFEASLDMAKGELARQKAILWNATQEKNRMEPLYKVHAASLRDLDNAIARELAAEADVETAMANVWNAELNLAYTTIQSPITGITSAANYREGSLITQNLSKPLTTVSVIDPIWVNFSLSEGEVLNLRRNVSKNVMRFPKNEEFTVEVLLADGSIYPHTGVVNFAEPYYDQNTGTITVRSTFPNPNALLKPDQFVMVHVYGAYYVNATLVPQSAVLQGNHGPFVYIVSETNRAEIVPIEMGDWWGAYWIVQAGLKPGDRVIVDGVNKVQIDSQVEVTQTLPQPPSKLTSGDPSAINFATQTR